MTRSDVLDGSTVLPVARIVFWADLVGVVLAGSQLAFTPDRTAEFASWTIAVPLTAASLGYGYWATVPSMIRALGIGAWRRTRILPTMALALTTLVLAATLRDLDLFHLDEGPTLARVTAWAWVALYAILPVMNLLSLALQARSANRRGKGSEPAPRRLAPWVRILFFVHALGLSVVGAGLYLSVDAFEMAWPWPVTRLTAAVIGSFLLTTAVGSWYAVRVDDWWAVRLAVPLYLLYPAGQLIAMTMFRSDLDDGVAPWIWAGVLGFWLLAFAVAARAQITRAAPLDRPAPPA